MLYFVVRKRTEVVFCDLLMGPNYICCYEQHLTVPAALVTATIAYNHSAVAWTYSHRRARRPMDGVVWCGSSVPARA